MDLDRAELRERLQEGFPIEPKALDGSRYLGVSLGLPALVDRLAWKTFEKVFSRDDSGLHGWNVRLKQRGFQVAEPMIRAGKPLTFGRFRVRDEGHRLMLDYSINPWWDPSRHLRDPLVALHEDSVEWLFGRSLIGSWATPSYFVLQRFGALEYVPAN